MLRRKVSFLYLGSLFFTGIALGADAIPNWSAPASWSPTRAAGVRTLADATPPLPFIGLPPCRILDTRGNGAPIQGGIFTGGSDVRNYTIPPICGVPSGVSAVSLNFTVTGPGQTTAGFLLAWPTGGAVPPVSILNWDRPQQQIANAAVVPTNGSGSITVNVSAPTHLIMDINGYYANTPATAINGFVIFNSGIAIFGSTNSTISGASGVLGQATATSGNVFGVSGSTSSTASTSAGVSGSGPVSGVVGTCTGPGCAGVFGESFVTGHANGVFGLVEATSTSSAGVLGIENATLGIVYGIYGQNFSTTGGAAAVRGQALATSGGTTGVWGSVRSTTNGAIGTYGEATGTSGITYGVFGATSSTSGLGVSFMGGLGGTGTKNFYEPHPTDPEKVIRYVSLEGPEAGTYFRGRGRLVHGRAVIEVPETFRIVTSEEGLTAQVTPIGRPTPVSISQIGLDRVIVEGTTDVEFSYLVQGVRRNYKDFEVVAKNPFFQPRSAEDRMIGSLSEGEKARLIANGTYNADGTVNMETAERLGWVKTWKEQEEQARAAAANAVSPRAAIMGENQ